MSLEQREFSTRVSSLGGMGEMTQENFMSWKGMCRGCGKVRRNGAGVFCSNFLMPRGSFPPCRNVWCGDCYVPHPNDPFPVQDLPEEDEGIEVPVNNDHANARGRDGDHLMGVPYECDLCQFRNVKRRNPILSNESDGYTLLAIRRVNLDVFGSRAP